MHHGAIKAAAFVASFVAASGAALSAVAQPLADAAMEAKARAIHDRVIALDTHVDIPLTFATPTTDPGGFTTSQVDLPKMRIGGLDAAFFIVYTPQGPMTEEGLAQAQWIAGSRFAGIDRFVTAYPERVAMAKKASDVAKIVRSGRKAALIGVENAFPLGDDLSVIEEWAERGVRYVGVTHFGHNQFGDSSNPNPERDEEEKWGGLSEAGRDLIAALNDAGIMVDASHAGRKTMLQAIEASRAPIIASHSGVKAIADSPRNLDDAQLEALRDSGGVVQLVALDAYVKPYTEEQIAFRDALRKELQLETSEQRAAASPETRAAYAERIKGMWEIEARANVADLVDHIDHAVKVAGVDHVGIASDFDGGGGVDGWADASETLNVTRELVHRGYSEDEIEKIWGGNLLRVLRAAEKAAR